MRKLEIKNPFLDWYKITYLHWKRKEIDLYVTKNFKESVKTPIEYDAVHYHQWHHSIVCIFSDEEKDIKVVIHEITHAVQRLLSYLNIPWEYQNTELVANLMMYYISEWLKFYKFISKI